MTKQMVSVFVIRHGKALTGAKGDELLPEGVEQVLKSVANNLDGIIFQKYFSSFRFRAMQTAELVAGGVEGQSTFIHRRREFDYLDELIEECGGGELMNKAAKDLATERGNTVVTIQDWMDSVPLWTKTMRGQVSEGLRSIAIEEAAKCDQPEFNLLVAAHSPLSETAAIDMAAMPRLQEADIVKYTIEVNPMTCGCSAQIIASDYIPRGF